MGAGVARFGTIVTVSVEDPEQFRRLDKEVPAMFSRTRLRVRKALANQAVTFQAGLPLGTCCRITCCSTTRSKTSSPDPGPPATRL